MSSALRLVSTTSMWTEENQPTTALMLARNLRNRHRSVRLIALDARGVRIEPRPELVELFPLMPPSHDLRPLIAESHYDEVCQAWDRARQLGSSALNDVKLADGAEVTIRFSHLIEWQMYAVYFITSVEDLGSCRRSPSSRGPTARSSGQNTWNPTGRPQVQQLRSICEIPSASTPGLSLWPEPSFGPRCIGRQRIRRVHIV